MYKREETLEPTNYHNVTIAESAHVAPSACLVGTVEIGENVTVMHAASARGDYNGRIVVGDGSNMQENACIHVDHHGLCQIGKNVTIGHGAILHGCTIGDESLVGMGATVIDGAVVGNHCLIGANALVTGTANIPDGMLVIGSPARAVRPLTPEEVENVALGAVEYQQLGKEMSDQGLLFTGREAVRAHCPQVALAKE